MAAQAHSDTTAPTRRALLAGVLGGIGAWVAGAIGRAGPVEAANGDPILAGMPHTATGTTSISSTTTSAAIWGIATMATSDNIGTAGQSNSATGRGLLGFAVNTSGRNYGVWGQSNSEDGTGVFGWNTSSNAGVVGVSGSVTPSSVPQARRTGVFGYASADTGSTGRGVWGRSSAGRAIMGTANTGWAGYFDGRLFVDGYIQMKEGSTPSAPGSNQARLFVRDNGSGKTQLCVRFATGAVRVLATQP